MIEDIAKESEIVTWRGNDINKLSREELISALNTCARLYENALQSNIRSHQFLRSLRESA